MPNNDWTPYEPVIGLEVHVRLGTQSKMFCDDPYSYGQEPNTLISPISMAYPGTLPRVNKRAIDFAIKIGLAYESVIAEEVIFDRKNYFYPDLPKGYQLTQDRFPVCKGGTVRIKSGNEIRAINLTKIHLEEDAGKSIHEDGTDHSLIDFNRAGTALIEIVTNPELKTPDEAYSFMYEMRRIVRALGIGDGNMEQGSLRCDANVSIRKMGSPILGTKVEIKNVNSFNNVKRALTEEIKRQIGLIKSGEKVISESRTFDANSGKTHGMRTKETLTDYRYFPDPDITPVIVDDKWINNLKSELPELPFEKELRYQNEYQLSNEAAAILTESNEISGYFEGVTSISDNPKISANWVIGPVRSVLNDKNLEINDFPISAKTLGTIIKLVDEGKISQHIAQKHLFPAAIDNPEEELGSLLKTVTGQDGKDTDLESLIEEIIRKYPKEANMLKDGKRKLIGMFMGHIMKATKGKADPKKAQDVLLRTLKIK